MQHFLSPISLNRVEMIRLCHSGLSQGHLHHCHPDCLISFSLVHTCSVPSNILVLTGHCFFLVCDFVRPIVFRIYFLVAFTLFRKISLFLNHCRRNLVILQKQYSATTFFFFCLFWQNLCLSYTFLSSGKERGIYTSVIPFSSLRICV